MAKVLLIVGHQEWAPGARNLGPNFGPTMEPGDDVYEFFFNRPIVEKAAQLLNARGVSAEVDFYQRGGNIARWSGASELLIEFHCNAFNRQASGTEVLYAAGSVKGKAAAQILQTALVKALQLPSRGIKSKVRSDRGGYLLHGVSQPALIPEPFFIDNDADLARAREVDLAEVYYGAIARIVAQIFP